MQTGQFFNGFSCSSTDSLIALGQSQDHIPGYRYLGAMDWDHGSAADEAGWTAINPADDNIMYAVSRYGQSVIRSTNRGASFSTVANFAGDGSWNSPIVISPYNPQIIYFGDLKVRRSTNAGTTWSATNGGANIDGSNPTLSLAVSATDADTAYVGTAPVYARSHIFRTANGGTSWTNITGSLPDRYPMDLAVDPTNAGIVYLAMGGFGSGHLYKSTDAGTTWNDISGSLPDAPTTAIAIDPLHTNNVYVGNDIGVYVSTDGGTNWSSFNTGLPDAVIAADLTISPSNRALRIATHGNGVWERRLLGELPANYFDYKASTMNYPAEGSADSIGIVYSTIRATFRSLSAQAQSDSFNVKLRILFDNAEVFSTTKRLAGMASGETRSVNFDAGYTPPQTGEYKVQAIALVSDQNASNDTTSAEFTIFGVPTIPLVTVTKQYSAYMEISSGESGPSGDDVQAIAGIPFNFLFDGYSYDSVQISTNGWMELGTGTPGKFRGLSTSSQLGAYFTATLAAKARPTKALGPWWNDLSTNGSGSAITYTTQGIAPDRVFIVQWKSIPAYYDANATTIRLNFQVKLYESTNVVEFCYGPVNIGTNPVVSQGASMGFKDYLGGDNRYYDLARRASGSPADLRADLSPLTDWPGPDSSYRIHWDAFGVSVSFMNGWNLVSLPVRKSDHSPASLFPNFVAGTLFRFDSGYKSIDSLVYGEGYWIKSSPSSSFQILGESLPTVSVPVKVGWNLIGSVDHEIAAPSGGIVASSAFGYGATGYAVSSTLKPGRGYWIKTGSAGTLSLGPISQAGQIAKEPNTDCSISITDKLGRQQTLYIAQNVGNKINLERYEMPPLPPRGAFDARFSSQRMLEAVSGELKDAATFPIQLQSPAYPLTITYKISDASGMRFIFEKSVGNNKMETHDLISEGVFTVSGEGSLQIKVVADKQVPVQFALRQNYPNPFNPNTAISFDLPGRSDVKLIIYDLLGKEVRKIADGEYEAGSYTLNVDFNTLASGVYLYRLTAGKFTDTKKMLLIR
jgi:hypothetical protein